MPLFGAHMSVAGGLTRAVEASVTHGCDTVQVFTKNASQWAAPPLDPAAAADFRKAIKAAGLKKTLAHDSYLINLASADETLQRRSVDALALELQRAEALGLTYLVAHPGAHLGEGEEVGLARIAAGIDEVHARCPGLGAKLLLETTAGQGTTLGHRFEHLAAILKQVRDPDRLGVCFDTCHVFAAGYALAPEAEYRATWKEFDRVIGLKWLKAFHVNDSLKPFGSRVDRHAHIGRGCLGEEPFRLLVKDRRFRALPMVLETPKEGPDGEDMDAVNLGVLRGMV
jgi:deoxyribonuclease-4